VSINYPPGLGRETRLLIHSYLSVVFLGEAVSIARGPLNKALTCTRRFCSPMTRDSTCDVPSGARTVSSGGGIGPNLEGTRATRVEEKLCCRVVRRKHKMAAETRDSSHPAAASLPTSHSALS
jgi:hypothetical protein